MLASKETADGQVSLNPLVYVCSMSEYNLPEFESCLLRRPEYVVLVVSDFEKIKDAADRFTRVIEARLPGIQVIRPDLLSQQSFDGRDLQSIQTWLEQILSPQLASLPVDYPQVCNLTGGTKVMALALMAASIPWAWLEYKADGAQKLQKLENKQGKLTPLAAEELAPAAPLNVAKLYSDQVRENKENKVIASPNSQDQAQKLWDGLEQQNTALKTIFGNATSGLEMLWMYGLKAPNYNKKMLTLKSQEFIGETAFSKEQLQWLDAWAALKPTSLEVTNNQIILAGNKNSRDDLRRWLSGDWLEQLTYNWLAEEIPTQSLAMNVSIRPESSDNSSSGERESDLLVHYQGRTSLVEIKTDLPPNENFASAIRQLASLSDRFGRTNKVLLVGPQLTQKHQNRLEDLVLRCNAEGILLAFNKADLLYAVLKGRQPAITNTRNQD